MKSISILSRDTLFAEMLAAELQEAGYNAVVGRASLPDLIIIDLDSVAAVQGFSALTFSREAASDIRRPFDIDDFISLVRDRLDSEKEVRKDSGSGLYVSEHECYAVYRNERIELSELEHGLALLLYRNRGSIVTPDELSQKVFDCESNPNLVRVYINYLRKKLDKAYDTYLIETVRGRGYMLREEKE